VGAILHTLREKAEAADPMFHMLGVQTLFIQQSLTDINSDTVFSCNVAGSGEHAARSFASYTPPLSPAHIPQYEVEDDVEADVAAGQQQAHLRSLRLQNEQALRGPMVEGEHLAHTVEAELRRREKKCVCLCVYMCACVCVCVCAYVSFSRSH
jgi:hypothetical protein